MGRWGELQPHWDPGESTCTGGGGIIGGHVYDEYTNEIYIHKLIVDPGLTFVNVVLEWDTINSTISAWPQNKTISCYTHHYSDDDWQYLLDKTNEYYSGSGSMSTSVVPYMDTTYVDYLGTKEIVYRPYIYSYSTGQSETKYQKISSSDFSYGIGGNIVWVTLNNGQNDISGPDLNTFKIISAKSVAPKS